jgi:hypothetical protein
MIKFDKPTNLNGIELIAELTAAGIKVANRPSIDGNGDFWLDITNKDKAKAEEIVAAHNGNTIAPQLTIEQKLASVGLSLDDLKTALGL